MRASLFLSTAAALLGACGVSARSVFAHFMVGNAANYTSDDWKTDIHLAQQAQIDAFALNIAYKEANIESSLPTAFSAAAGMGFKLFFSFDYAGNGAWPKDEVDFMLEKYTALSAYFKYNGKYLVSTFEGPDSADDWIDLKNDRNVFFIPDWSSLGAKAALTRGGGVADGLFSWAAWPWGPQDMDTYTDASYLQYLNGKPYMMPISPWFFTNLPGYNKNWLWRGDSLWYDRWVQASYNKTNADLIDNTQFVEIISWNDYGESDYIGPLYDKAMEAFTIGKGPSNFAKDMPHDGWRLFLPYVIGLFKTGTATITQEGLTAWYRLSPGAACASTGTTGNTASQLQIEFPPNEVVQNKIFFSALLTSEATISVTVGGVQQAGASYIPFSGTGAVVVTLSRNGATIAQVDGKAIESGCTSSLYNAWVGSATVSGSVYASPSLSISKQACVNGTGVNNFAGLCGFACEYGYCPATACTCRQMGKAIEEPPTTGVIGYPIFGESANYSGLCAYNCNHGYCPSGAYGTTEVPLTIPDVSDFSPPACRAGTGTGALTASAARMGALIDAPAKVAITGKPIAGLEDYGLCDFVCSHGYCPDVCVGTGSGSSGNVYYPPSIWEDSQPHIPCLPPCKVILPPYPIGSTTTITFSPLVTSVWTVSAGHTDTKTTTITLAPLVTDAIPFWPITVGPSVTTPVTVFPLQSFMPPSAVITLNGNEATFSPVPSGSATPAPSFPGTERPVTIQPQATSSVTIKNSVPSVTWSSAKSTATCTSGCGTDSCKVFGGCSSTDPADDCGTQGCGGGCSIQGCDQTCGIVCSTDQYHVPSDGTDGTDGTDDSSDPRMLPFDYDGPDGPNSGSWNPSPIDKSFASSATSAIERHIATAAAMVSSMIDNWDDKALMTRVQATATSARQALSTIQSKLESQLEDVADSSNTDNSGTIYWLAHWFKLADESLDLAAYWAINMGGPADVSGPGVGAAKEAERNVESFKSVSEIIDEKISLEANDDICDTEHLCNDCILEGFSITGTSKGTTPPSSCPPTQSSDPGEATNADEIPTSVDCASNTGINNWSREEILKTLKQGVNYKRSDAIGDLKKGEPNWQYSTKGMYPHVYSNSDQLSFTEECKNAADNDFDPMVEFPIIKGGVLQAGKNGKQPPGTDRVVFRSTKKDSGAPLRWIYCGVMTHHTKVKEKHKIGDSEKDVLPFRLCA
ncbi:glycosyl hydrolase family 71-domain-containing protein [Neurospora tetraspora]|uniref:Glycosyl hydrolase family 71-domain-containing protein n=1 Tax=Neurospora tetraspora TaxID=94610 RepID=A0AAE0JGR9_9PEZI|nr:glycosyl hydrolase family 71-domain-containing protein [Neurospora tetraspora]